LSKGKRTSGVDKGTITTNKQKVELAERLALDGKSARIRRVWIPKPGKDEKRPLGIPTIRDRAKQALAKLALEPQWEAHFEPNSYGFRPGRCAQDAIEAIFSNLRGRDGKEAKWVFDADIKKCFDKIDHDALLHKLNTFPRMRAQIRAWLKAGILDPTNGNSLTLPEQGTPQGGGISPLLANVALHGLEEELNKLVCTLPAPYKTSNRGNAAKIEALGVVRYADDFIITHPVRETLELCIIKTRQFLARVGLEVSDEKSQVRNATEGFKFLGFRVTVIQAQGKLKVKIFPSKEASLRLFENVRQVLKRNKSTAAKLVIAQLAPKIVGWCNYYKYCECSLVFRRAAHMVYLMLQQWVRKRSNRKGTIELNSKYFPQGQVYTYHGRKHHSKWVFAVLKDGMVTDFLPEASWIPKKKWVKVIGTSSPLDPTQHIYWLNRLASFGNKRENFLMKRQNATCPHCKGKFTIDSTYQTDHIVPRAMGGKDQYRNLQLLHIECHREKTNTDRPLIKAYQLAQKQLPKGQKGKAKPSGAAPTPTVLPSQEQVKPSQPIGTGRSYSSRASQRNKPEALKT